MEPAFKFSAANCWRTHIHTPQQISADAGFLDVVFDPQSGPWGTDTAECRGWLVFSLQPRETTEVGGVHGG